MKAAGAKKAAKVGTQTVTDPVSFSFDVDLNKLRNLQMASYEFVPATTEGKGDASQSQFLSCPFSRSSTSPKLVC